MSEADGAPEVSPQEPSPQEHWEAMYTEREQRWSGKPNDALVDVVEPMPAGHAIDLGAGEGADAIWLVRQGWTVTGVDISTTALRRARDAANATDIDADQIRWVEEDLDSWQPDERVDLVSACFLHSTIDFDRTAVIQRIATAVRPGGHLLVVSHAAPPPWAEHHHEHDEMPSASDEVEELELNSNRWQLLICEHRTRPATGPDGERAELEDVVILAERRPE